jgi:hypothetical protein
VVADDLDHRLDRVGRLDGLEQAAGHAEPVDGDGVVQALAEAGGGAGPLLVQRPGQCGELGEGGVTPCAKRSSACTRPNASDPDHRSVPGRYAPSPTSNRQPQPGSTGITTIGSCTVSDGYPQPNTKPTTMQESVTVKRPHPRNGVRTKPGTVQHAPHKYVGSHKWVTSSEPTDRNRGGVVPEHPRGDRFPGAPVTRCRSRRGSFSEEETFWWDDGTTDGPEPFCFRSTARHG